MPVECSRVAVLREISVTTGWSCGILSYEDEESLFRVQAYIEGSPSFAMEIITSWDSGIASLCDIRIHPWYLPYQAIYLRGRVIITIPTISYPKDFDEHTALQFIYPLVTWIVSQQ